jgi:protein phosphatase
MQVDYFGDSDVGLHRKHNEDSYLCNPEENLFLLADGIGGQAAGEIASRVAIEAMEEFIVQTRSEDITWPVPYRKEYTMGQNRLLAAASQANRKILKLANENPLLKGMGTTLVGVLIEGNNLVVVNVGDSRLYRVRNRELIQITEDHTLVGEQERSGLLTKEEAANHPHKHILTSALGIGAVQDIKIDLSVTEMLEKDLYLICSDGLSDMLDDREILKVIDSADSSLENLGVSLIQQANAAGGRDNITVVLLYIH